MSKMLNIGSIKLPVQAATKGFAFIGKRSSGKSYGAADLAEEFAEVRVPFVVFDPIDVWWGLRIAADGKGKGLPVVVFGKEHADIQLTRGMGREIAHAVVRENVSCVISTFGMGKTEMREIIADFSETLLNINNTPRHVFIEEAHEFVPQRVMGSTARCFAAVEALIVMGRNRGIGVSLLNQRMATINKDVVSQIDTLFAFRSVGPQDRKALRDWVQAHEAVYAEGEVESDFDKFIKSVPSLPSGEAWIWSPEFLEVFERVKFRKRRTFHPDREKIGTTFKMPTLAATDIQSFVDSFAASKAKPLAGSMPKPVNGAQRALVLSRQDKAREEHDRRLAKQELATEYKRGYGEGEMVGDARGYERAKREDKKQIDGLLKMLEQIGRLVAGVPKDQISIIPAPLKPSLPKSTGFMSHVSIGHPGTGAGLAMVDGEKALIQGGAVRMLKVLVSKYPMAFSRSQLATLSDVKAAGGTFRTYLSQLRQLGLMEESDGNVRATQSGIDYFGGDLPQPQSPEETRDMWRGNLDGGARRMFEVLEQAYPQGYDRATLAEASQVAAVGGTFRTYLSILKTNGLIKEEGGVITLSDTLV